MKNRIKLIAPFAVLTVAFVLHQFSCLRSDDSSLFGDIGQSPLRKEAETAQAVEIQDTFRKIFNLYKDRVVFITTEQVVRVQPNPFFDDPFMRDFFGAAGRPAHGAAPRPRLRLHHFRGRVRLHQPSRGGGRGHGHGQHQRQELTRRRSSGPTSGPISPC